jgi:hypothetical protein
MGDLNRMFLNYLILLNMGYKILRMEQNWKIYYILLVRKCQILQHYAKCRLHNVITLFSQKLVYFLQEKKKTCLVIRSS